ncbi:unnamed protein product [Rotaria sordida]|uniref:Rab-GAP TBC domain-containing protein n=2 Tax=Rotaria sordida TaxID=392033 RepID=A0A818LVC3_9BILA|nr:unnamed protein product [Rotaria sordida]CAF3575078.1 unnamed protein product [Rotaria sordida]
MTQSHDVSLPDMTNDDVELLKKLEEENRRIEYDLKSPASAILKPIVNTHSPELHHKQGRKDSISSDLSNLTIDSDGNLDNEWVIWNKLVNNWSLYMKKKSIWIKDLIRSGVPVHFRPLLWQSLTKIDTTNTKEKYIELIKMSSPCEKVIQRDISRTYPEHEFFKEQHGLGQESLFNVIKAYSLYDREVGYCQGMSFVVGLLLMHMPEEEAFAVLVSIMQDYTMREMYKPDMYHLGLCMYQFECMIQEFLPDLYRHFQAEGLHTSMYASSWFLTLFTKQFSLNMVCRIMDLFLSEGMEMIFRISMGLLEIHQDELMLLSMEDMLKYFQKEIPLKHETDHESLFQRAFSLEYNGKKMKKLEKEYTVIRKEEQDEQIEIRKLRNENRLLKQRVENLEKESLTLANRLIEGQVLNAQYAEESYQLKRENCTLKKQIEEFYHSNNNNNNNNNHDSNNQTKNINSSDFLVKSNDNELEILQETIDRLSDENRRLQSTPNSELASLQEELTLVKMRDAEAQVNLNELRQRIADLNREWQFHDSICKANREINNNPSNDAYDLIAHELISLKMREAQADCDNKLLSQKLMDIETQKQVLHNQIKRQDDEIQRVRLELDQYRIRENELRTQLKEIKNQMHDRELRLKEDSMMLRIHEAESTQTLGDLRQKIAELEVLNQELITRSQIMDDRDLQEKLLEFQDEVMRLRLIHTLNRKQSISTDHTRIDYEDSEDESLPSSSSNTENHRLSSSFGIDSNSTKESNHRLRLSTPCLFQSTDNNNNNNTITQCVNSSTLPLSSRLSSSINKINVE